MLFRVVESFGPRSLRIEHPCHSHRPSEQSFPCGNWGNANENPTDVRCRKPIHASV